MKTTKEKIQATRDNRNEVAALTNHEKTVLNACGYNTQIAHATVILKPKTEAQRKACHMAVKKFKSNRAVFIAFNSKIEAKYQAGKEVERAPVALGVKLEPRKLQIR
jgi:hypothetical protein